MRNRSNYRCRRQSGISYWFSAHIHMLTDLNLTFAIEFVLCFWKSLMTFHEIAIGSL